MTLLSADAYFNRNVKVGNNLRSYIFVRVYGLGVGLELSRLRRKL
jgi:hypothetical protein